MIARRPAAERYARHLPAPEPVPVPTPEPEGHATDRPPGLWLNVNEHVRIGDSTLIVVDVRPSGVVRLGVNSPPSMGIRKGEVACA